MIKKTVLTGLVSAALFVALSTMPTTIPFTQSAQAAKSSCLPASVKARLNQIRQKFGPIKIVSTHRPGARIASSGKKSYHASCRAVDFHPPKGKYGAVVKWLKANHNGGVGTYSCGMHHIHIDNGPRVRFHHCVNKHGTPLKKGKKKRHYAKKKTYKKKYTSTKYNKPVYAVGKKQTYSYTPSQSVHKKTYNIYY